MSETFDQFASRRGGIPSDACALIRLEIAYLNSKLVEEERKAGRRAEPVHRPSSEQDRLAAFNQRHGTEALFVGGRPLYPDGSIWDGDVGIEPPRNPARRAVLELEYLREKLRLEQRVLDRCQRNAATQGLIDRHQARTATNDPRAAAEAAQMHAGIRRLREQVAEKEAYLREPETQRVLHSNQA